MSRAILNEIENLDLELIHLKNRKLNEKDQEYFNYLVSKIERLSKEFLINCSKKQRYDLEDILMRYFFEYGIETYFKLFSTNNIAS
ncbi:hypothetical protein [Clostridium perfringens]|uniref:hypothetical protein n=2 Tax=Clostridium perfringens TaxID=1502 RepID=UPI000D71B4ED|nr:hypothetical protein [Clostridium perfringens]PWW90757.1 hypothetical protein CYK76_15150 [Clostridium perfringens]PWX70071.1 hypothetical protein CYK77_14190 [Clostridium perfringens]